MKKLLSIIMITGVITGCALHRVDIQQGNVLTAQMVDSLKPGMDKRQVRFIMGTPPVADPYHPQRWDYVYSERKHGEPPERYHVVLFFDANERLGRIERRIPPPAWP